MKLESKLNLFCFAFPVSRGDVFDLPEENLTYTVNPTVASGTKPSATLIRTTVAYTSTSTPISDPQAEICSGKSFDAFLQTKNGSIYAFRGKITAYHDFSRFPSEHLSVIWVLNSRWILLWTGWEVSDAGLSQTHKGRVGNFWAYRCRLYSN